MTEDGKKEEWHEDTDWVTKRESFSLFSYYLKHFSICID